MFSTSSQLKFWTFQSTSELKKLKQEANHNYIQKFGAHISVLERNEFFLTEEEETKVKLHYEYVLHDFCRNFFPPMPKYVLGTSLMFFKRFYLHNSVMDYHPNDMIYICCYLACKTEEFNVSLVQFVQCMHDGSEAHADMILSMELLLMQQLHYHLTVHNPFRPLEGLLIDIKTRCPFGDQADKIRPGADEFIDRALHTDIPLMFAPSQIALASLLSSGAKCGLSLDNYVANKLLASGGKDNLMKTVDHIKKIRYLVKSHENPDRNEIRLIEEKLDRCRNQNNNPFSEQYKNKMEELMEEEGERQSQKRQRIAEEERQHEQDLLGLS